MHSSVTCETDGAIRTPLKKRIMVIAAALLLALTFGATDIKRAEGQILKGALIGAGVGAIFGGRRGAVAGAIAGGIIGGMSKRRKRYRRYRRW